MSEKKPASDSLSLLCQSFWRSRITNCQCEKGFFAQRGDSGDRGGERGKEGRRRLFEFVQKAGREIHRRGRGRIGGILGAETLGEGLHGGLKGERFFVGREGAREHVLAAAFLKHAPDVVGQAPDACFGLEPALVREAPVGIVHLPLGRVIENGFRHEPLLDQSASQKTET